MTDLEEKREEMNGDWHSSLHSHKMSIDRPVDKGQFYSAVSTTFVVGVVSVSLSMCPALAIFGIPLAGALGEWTRKHGGDLNPRPLNTTHSLTTRSNGETLSPVHLNTARCHSIPVSPHSTDRSIQREFTQIHECNVSTAKCVSPLTGTSQIELEMGREGMKTAVENSEITARSCPSEKISLTVHKTVIYRENSTAKELQERSPRVCHTPIVSERDDVKQEGIAVTPLKIFETPKMKKIELSPEVDTKTSLSTEMGQKTGSSISSPSPLLFTPPVVRVNTQPLTRSSHMTSTSERPRVRRHRKRSRERI